MNGLGRNSPLLDVRYVALGFPLNHQGTRYPPLGKQAPPSAHFLRPFVRLSVLHTERLFLQQEQKLTSQDSRDTDGDASARPPNFLSCSRLSLSLSSSFIPARACRAAWAERRTGEKIDSSGLKGESAVHSVGLNSKILSCSKGKLPVALRVAWSRVWTAAGVYCIYFSESFFFLLHSLLESLICPVIYFTSCCCYRRACSGLVLWRYTLLGRETPIRGVAYQASRELISAEGFLLNRGIISTAQSLLDISSGEVKPDHQWTQSLSSTWRTRIRFP